MTLTDDPLYHAFKDYMNGITDLEITIRNADFDDDAIPVSYFFREFRQMPLIEQKAMKLCKGIVLDIGAGAGAHSIYLKNKGFNITAIDKSPGCCDCLRLRGLNQVECTDLLNFETSQKYDTILLLMNGLGVAGSIDSLPEVMNKIKSLIAPGGQVLFDSSDLIYLFEKDGAVEIDLNAKYYGQGTYEMIYKSYSTGEFEWLYIDYPLVKEIAEESGWTCDLIMEGDHFDYLARLTLS